MEKIIRREAPAHIGLRFCWLTSKELTSFEVALRKWRIALVQNPLYKHDYQEAKVNMIQCLNQIPCNNSCTERDISESICEDPTYIEDHGN